MLGRSALRCAASGAPRDATGIFARVPCGAGSESRTLVHSGPQCHCVLRPRWLYR